MKARELIQSTDESQAEEKLIDHYSHQIEKFEKLLNADQAVELVEVKNCYQNLERDLFEFDAAHAVRLFNLRSHFLTLALRALIKSDPENRMSHILSYLKLVAISILNYVEIFSDGSLHAEIVGDICEVFNEESLNEEFSVEHSKMILNDIIYPTILNAKINYNDEDFNKFIALLPEEITKAFCDKFLDNVISSVNSARAFLEKQSKSINSEKDYDSKLLKTYHARDFAEVALKKFPDDEFIFNRKFYFDIDCIRLQINRKMPVPKFLFEMYQKSLEKIKLSLSTVHSDAVILSSIYCYKQANELFNELCSPNEEKSNVDECGRAYLDGYKFNIDFLAKQKETVWNYLKTSESKRNPDKVLLLYQDVFLNFLMAYEYSYNSMIAEFCFKLVVSYFDLLSTYKEKEFSDSKESDKVCFQLFREYFSRFFYYRSNGEATLGILAEFGDRLKEIIGKLFSKNKDEVLRFLNTEIELEKMVISFSQKKPFDNQLSQLKEFLVKNRPMSDLNWKRRLSWGLDVLSSSFPDQKNIQKEKSECDEALLFQYVLDFRSSQKNYYPRWFDHALTGVLALKEEKSLSEVSGYLKKLIDFVDEKSKKPGNLIRVIHKHLKNQIEKNQSQESELAKTYVQEISNLQKHLSVILAKPRPKEEKSVVESVLKKPISSGVSLEVKETKAESKRAESKEVISDIDTELVGLRSKKQQLLEELEKINEENAKLEQQVAEKNKLISPQGVGEGASQAETKSEELKTSVGSSGFGMLETIKEEVQGEATEESEAKELEEDVAEQTEPEEGEEAEIEPAEEAEPEEAEIEPAEEAEPEEAEVEPAEEAELEEKAVKDERLYVDEAATQHLKNLLGLHSASSSPTMESEEKKSIVPDLPQQKKQDVISPIPGISAPGWFFPLSAPPEPTMSSPGWYFIRVGSDGKPLGAFYESKASSNGFFASQNKMVLMGQSLFAELNFYLKMKGDFEHYLNIRDQFFQYLTSINESILGSTGEEMKKEASVCWEKQEQEDLYKLAFSSISDTGLSLEEYFSRVDHNQIPYGSYFVSTNFQQLVSKMEMVEITDDALKGFRFYVNSKMQTEFRHYLKFRDEFLYYLKFQEVRQSRLKQSESLRVR